MDLSHKTDEEVAILIQRGEIDAFAEIVARYEEKLLRYAHRFLLRGEDAKDLVQNVFIKAYTNLQDFDSNRRFSPWIYRIAHNEYLNAIESRTARKTFSLLDMDIFFPQPAMEEEADDEAKRKETRALLEKSLAELPPKYREALVLYYFEDMDYREISDILQIPIATVGVRLKRGREMLRNRVDKEYKF